MPLLEEIKTIFERKLEIESIDLRNEQLANLMTIIECHYKINLLDLDKTENKEALNLYQILSLARDFSIYPNAIE